MKIVGYKTVNKVNGKFYYGVRKLRNDKDSYIGSGLRLLEAVKKYGRDKFTRFDLVEFETLEEAFEWERQIVTQELVDDPNCYNLKKGGHGGGEPWDEERKQYHKEKGTYAKSKEVREKISQAAIERFQHESGTFTGKIHSKESRDLMSIQRKGLPGNNKGKKLNLSEERLAELRKPKSAEVRKKISRALCQLTDEQIRFLQEDFEDLYGERTKLAKEWNISLDQISRIIGTRNKKSIR
jgi:hypothetical protein